MAKTLSEMVHPAHEIPVEPAVKIRNMFTIEWVSILNWNSQSDYINREMFTGISRNIFVWHGMHFCDKKISGSWSRNKYATLVDEILPFIQIRCKTLIHTKDSHTKIGKCKISQQKLGHVTHSRVEYDNQYDGQVPCKKEDTVSELFMRLHKLFF